MELILLAAGMALGAALAYFYLKSQQATFNEQLKAAQQKIADTEKREQTAKEACSILQTELSRTREEAAILKGKAEGTYVQLSKTEAEQQLRKQEITQLNAQLLSSGQQFSALKSAYEHLQKQFAQKETEVLKLEERLKEAFQNLSNDILDRKSQRFTELNKEQMHQILQPLQEKIKAFELQIKDAYEKEARERFSLADKIKDLILLNHQLGDEARSLTQALKGDSKMQGNWGEMILQRILEESGLRKDSEYFVQESFEQAGGKRLQPDVVIRYPGNKSVVIDAKVSLVAYERFVQSNDKEVQQNTLKSHLQSLRNHINGLSGKNYQDLYQLNSLDYVLLFVPIEPAFMLAVQADPQLWKFAYDKRVLLISPTNLIAVLKIIHELWKVESYNQNAKEIAERGGKLYDKFVLFVESLQDIGKELDQAQGKYQVAVKQLYEGNGNLIGQVEKLKELGVNAKKVIPALGSESVHPKE